MDKPEKQYDEEGRVIRENRSEAKREREKIKAFARELLQLPGHQYELLPVDERLREALLEGKRLSGNALARHLIFLTKLLDQQDYPTIAAAFRHVNHPRSNDAAKLRRIQREMELLLAGDRDIFSELLQRYRDLDIQYVRQLLREHHKQPAGAEPSKQQRALQKYLSGLMLRPE